MAEPTKTPEKPSIPKGMVKCRILKRGAGKFSTGDRKDNKDVKRDKGDFINLPRKTAALMEDRAWVEIEG